MKQLQTIITFLLILPTLSYGMDLRNTATSCCIIPAFVAAAKTTAPAVKSIFHPCDCAWGTATCCFATVWVCKKFCGETKPTRNRKWRQPGTLFKNTK